MTEQQTATASDATGDRWGDPISEERQAELQGYLGRWAAEQDHGERKGPFDGGPGEASMSLTGADVFWLAEQSGRNAYSRVLNLHLEGANLSLAHLEEANLSGAGLLGTDLSWAVLIDANLSGANLIRANLSGANLMGARMDVDTQLRDNTFDSNTRLGDVVWNGVLLTLVDWRQAPRLGEEGAILAANTHEGRIGAYRTAVRAYRQLATILRAEGLAEDADRYAYRAQVLQRRGQWHDRQWPRWFGSFLLDLIAGYGYRPLRSVVAYVAIVCAFAGAYFLNGHFVAPHLKWDEALVLSISAFHGRGFFTSGISLGGTLARLAAGEAIIGLLVEITFIATFTQRFFAR